MMTTKCGKNSIPTGTILRIELEHFMTHTHFVLEPSPGLNLIMGPNGTGKSSIVCALNIGFGGSPSNVNRGSNLATFIQHGRNTGRVLITLQSEQDRKTPYVLEAVLSRESSQSPVYRFCGKMVTKLALRNIAKHLQIQISNPCQFLAQDKVLQFSKQNPQQLFSNTMQAVCSKEVKDEFDQLIRRKTEMDTMKAELDGLTNSLHEMNQEKELLTPAYSNHLQRNRRMQLVKLIDQKLLVLKYRKARHGVSAAKLSLDAKSKAVAERTETLAPFLADLQGKREEAAQFAAKHGIHLGSKISEEIEEIEKLRQCYAVMEAAKTQLEELIERCQREQSGREQSERRLKALQDEHQQLLDKCINTEDRKNFVYAEVARLRNGVAKWRQSTGRVRKQMDDCRRNITSLRNGVSTAKSQLKAAERRLEDRNQSAAGNAFRGSSSSSEESSICRLMDWTTTEQGRNSLSHPVYHVHETIKPKSKIDCLYLENVISHRDLDIVVTENKEDYDIITAYGKREGLQFNAAAAPTSEKVHPKNIQIPAEMEENGLDDLLLNRFEAPDPVLRFLLGVYPIDRIGIASDELISTHSQLAQDHCQQLGLISLISSTTKMMLRESRYSGNVSVAFNPTKTPRLIRFTDPMIEERANEEIQGIQRKIQELENRIQTAQTRLEKLETEKTDYESTEQGLERQMEALKQEYQDYRSLQRGIDDRKAKIDKLVKVQDSSNVMSLDEFKREIWDTYQKRLDAYGEVLRFQEIVWEKLKERIVATAELEQKRKILEMQEEDLKEKQEVLSAEKEKVHSEAVTLGELKEDAKQLYEQLKKRCNASSEEDLTRHLEIISQQFIDAKIDEMDAGELELMRAKELEHVEIIDDAPQNEQIVEKYENIEADIKAAAETINDLEAKLHQLEIAQNEQHERCIPAVKEMVAQINRDFKIIFNVLGFEGCVELHWDSKENYESFRIDLSVRFRSSSLVKRLTVGRQSGGERSVSTICYILALQRQTKVPFRVVDEINQGMDETNELKVFQAMISILTEHQSGQYFMLTPKVIPDVQYGDSCNVIILYNGHHLPNQMCRLDWKAILGESDDEGEANDTEIIVEEEIVDLSPAKPSSRRTPDERRESSSNNTDDENDDEENESSSINSSSLRNFVTELSSISSIMSSPSSQISLSTPAAELDITAGESENQVTNTGNDGKTSRSSTRSARLLSSTPLTAPPPSTPSSASSSVSSSTRKHSSASVAKEMDGLTPEGHSVNLSPSPSPSPPPPTRKRLKSPKTEPDDSDITPSMRKSLRRTMGKTEPVFIDLT